MSRKHVPEAVSFIDSSAAPEIEYHEASHTFRTQFDSHSRPPSEAVVAAVATATDRDPLELPPLYSVVDPDALDRVFGVSSTGRDGDGGTVTFGYGDCRVTVQRRGTIQVKPSEESTWD